jgi:hypothetical protein
MALGSLLKRYIFALVLFMLLTDACGSGFPKQLFPELPSALYPTVTGRGLRDCFVNQASLATIQHPAAGFTFHSRFGVSELSVKSAALILPANNGTFAITYYNRGIPDLMYHSFAASAGKKLSDLLSFGVEAGLNAAIAPATDMRHLTATCEAGVIISPGDKLRIGLHVTNPIPNSLRSYPLPSSIKAGAESIISDRVSISLLFEKASMQPLSISTGFSYKAAESVVIRAGYTSSTSSFGFTFGYSFGRYDTELSFLTHTRLGLSSVASLFASLRK